MTNAEASNTANDALDAPVLPVVPNPRGYPPFNLRYLPTYTNNQLCYYHISGAMFDVDEDSNQFYLRLFNLGIQTDLLIDFEGYRTRLIKLLRNLIR